MIAFDCGIQSCSLSARSQISHLDSAVNPDRRSIAAVSLIAAAWIEVAAVGMPSIPPVPQIYPNNFAGPHGFPLWVRCSHFLNFLFVMLSIPSGISILMDHPRLYFNDHCTPGTEWARLTPI